MLRPETLEELEEKQGYQNGTPTENCDGKPLQPHTKMINRGDLNRLVVKSPLPAAVEYERIVFEEILVQVQVRGYYIGARAKRDDYGASRSGAKLIMPLARATIRA